jgi:tetratricopeptide (TPR) repeat protein
MAARKHRWLAVGWFWFVGMLVPVIGLVQVGNQLMADRYSYLPSIGFFIIIVWTGWTVVRNYAINPKPAMGVAAAILVCAGWAASRQTLIWQNCETLFDHSLKLNPRNYVAHNILGTGLRRLGRMDDAKAHYLAAMHVQQEHPDILHKLGVMLNEQGRYSEATNYLAQAVRLKPALTANYCKLAFFLDAQGKAGPAIIYYRECLRRDRDNITGCNNLAWLLATQADPALRNGGEAVQLGERANLLTSYQQPALLGTLAAAYAEAGRFSDAITTAEKARDLANASGLNEIAARNNSLLEVYRKGQPYREGK